MYCHEGKAKEYGMFISVNASEEKLDKDMPFYYPFEKVDVYDVSITPINMETHLNFYKNNVENFEKLSKCVKFVVAITKDLNNYNTGIANTVCLKLGDVERKCHLSCFKLVCFSGNVNYMITDIDIYSVTDVTSLSKLLKEMDFMTKLKSIKEKQARFERILDRFDMKRMEVDKLALKYRSEFGREIEGSNNTYLVRDPRNDEVIHPVIDLLVLHDDNDTDTPIIIDLNHFDSLSNNDLVEKGERNITYITHHIPKAFPLDNHDELKKWNKLKKEIENCNLKSFSIEKRKTSYYYEHLRSLSFSKNCCIYYDRSVNFGKIDGYYFKGLATGYFTFNVFSAGSLLFDFEFKPIGLAISGSYDFYPYTNIDKLYNIILPFQHLGVLYVFRRLLGDNILLKDYLDSKCLIAKDKSKPGKSIIFRTDRVERRNDNSPHDNEHVIHSNSKKENVKVKRKRIGKSDKERKRTSVDKGNQILELLEENDKGESNETISEYSVNESERNRRTNNSKERIRKKYSPLKYVLATKKRQDDDTLVLSRGRVSGNEYNNYYNYIDNLGRKKRDAEETPTKKRKIIRDEDNESDAEESEKSAEDEEAEEDELEEESSSNSKKILGKKTLRP
jgi:hypothetical protein